MGLTAPWLCLLALSATPTAAASIPVAPRTPALAVVITPFGRASAAGTSALVDGLAGALEARAGLELLSVEQAGVDLQRMLACPGERRLSCWAQLAGEGAAARAPRHLFVISARPLEDGRDRVALIWMDLERSRSALDGEPGLSVAAREDRLFTEALHTPPVMMGADALDAAFATLVEDQLQDELRARGLWGARGAVVVEHGCEACELRLDGRSLGAVAPGRARLEQVPLGPHSVALRGLGEAQDRCEGAVTVRGGGTAEALALGACEDPARAPALAPTVVRWTGVALAATGLVLGAVAVERAAAGPDTICVGRNPSCTSIGAPSVRFDAGAAPTADPARLDPGGPSWAAFSAGLVTAGGALTAGSWLFDGEDWWWSPIAAAVLGGAAFATATALGGG